MTRKLDVCADELVDGGYLTCILPLGHTGPHTSEDKVVWGGHRVVYLFGLAHPSGPVTYRGKTFLDAGMFEGPPKPCVGQRSEWTAPEANLVLLMTAAGGSFREAVEQVLLTIGQNPRLDLEWTVRLRTMREQLADLGI